MDYGVTDFEAYIGPHRLFVEGVRPEMETGNPSILFVGGAFDGSWVCRPQLDYWAAHGWPAYALNLRGYYKSTYHDVAGLGYQDYLDDILAVRDHLGLREVIYAGYSMGGILVQKFAELYGAHALILYDSDPPRQVALQAGEKPDEKQHVPPVMNFWPTQEIAEEMLGKAVSTEDFHELLEYFKQSFLSGRAYRELEIERVEVDAAQITCPVLLIGVSLEDPVQSAMARYYNASRLVFEGYSHGSILFSRFHTPITRRVTAWMNTGFPLDAHETYGLEEITAEEEEGERLQLLYFTKWQEPEIRICSRRGQELSRVAMRRREDGRDPDESIFEAAIRLIAGEKFYLTCKGREDRPGTGGYYEPCGVKLYLKDGEFFSRFPPKIRREPAYLSREFHSPALDHTFTVNIMLPRDYDQSENPPYPVAVLNDGQNQWKVLGAHGGWYTDFIAVDRARSGRCRDMVLVSIFAHPRRDRAYLPPPHGTVELYVDFVADTVLPALRNDLHISDDPGAIGIIGASYGATCAVYAGMKRPDVFGLVGSFSYPYISEDPVRPWMRSLDALPIKKLYVDCGTRWAYDQPDKGDFEEVTRDLIAIAVEKGMAPEENLLGIIARGHFHNEEFWRKRIGRCLEFLYPLR